MKRILLSIALTLVAVTMFSQNGLYCVFSLSEINDIEETTHVRDLNYMMNINIEKQHIIIDDLKCHTFDLSKEYTIEKSLSDDQGELFDRYSFYALDRDSLNCNLEIEIYKDYDLIFIMANYKDICMMWSGTTNLQTRLSHAYQEVEL